MAPEESKPVSFIDPLDAQLDRRRSTVLSKERAFLTILAGAMYADDKTRRAEAVELEALIGRVKTLQVIPEADRKKARDEAVADVVDKNMRKDRVVLACGALLNIMQASAKTETDPDKFLAESAFAHACDLICTDHDVPNEEKVFLRLLETELKIARDRADLIFKTLALKNEY
jgi:hypothetical protein